MKKQLLRAITLGAILTIGTAQVSAVGLGAWAGYNVASGTATDLSFCEAYKGTSGECTKGGIAFGGDLWLFGIPGIPINLGIGGAYVPISYQKYTFGTATAEVSQKYIPVYAQGRVDLMGFFAGVTVGYGLSVSTATSSTSAYIVPTAAAATFGIGGFIGYGLGIGPLSIEAGARVFSLSSTFSIMPFVGVTLKI